MPFKPKIIEALKSYNRKKLLSDLMAGLMVALVAMPLSIAIAAASGVSPERGIYTAVIAGFFVALLGGSNVNITGPTAAFITLVYNIVTKYGIDGLIAATIMAGIMLILMGFLKLGSLVKYIPQTIITGFSAGLSISIIIGQTKHIFGLTLEGSPIEGIDKLGALIQALDTFSYQSFIIGIIALALMIFLPKWSKKIPQAIVVIVLSSLLVWIFGMDVQTVGGVFGEIKPPHFEASPLSLDKVISLIPEAFTIAILAAIESMLSSVISDGMINDKTNSNTELIALGFGNIAAGIFGGIPATGAITRTAVNVKNGGRTPISAMIHAVAILLASLIFFPFTYFIPMPAIAAILMVTVFNMADWKRLIHICKTAENAEIIILIVTFILTIFFNLMTAIATGLILTAFLFLREMADSANVRPWTGAGSRTIPEGSAIYELNGPMFFAATDKLLEINSSERGISVIILRASNMTLLDIEAIKNLEKLVEECKRGGVTVIVSHIKDQPLRAMQKVGLVEKIGEENFVLSIGEAIELAEKILDAKENQRATAAEEERLRRAALAEEKKKRADEQTAAKRKKAMEKSAKAAESMSESKTPVEDAAENENSTETTAENENAAENISEIADAAEDDAEAAENTEKV